MKFDLFILDIKNWEKKLWLNLCVVLFKGRLKEVYK